MNEKKAPYLNGYIGLILILGLAGLAAYSLWMEQFVLGIVLAALAFLLLTSITVIQPNQANVITFFGKYMGTARESGLWLTVPFSSRRKMSLRVRNFNSVKLKVNDIEGNPIEIAAVVVFRVIDTAKASYDVESYEQFVEIQSETALRHVATRYPYDNLDQAGYSLRGNAEEVALELGQELQNRLAVAGVEVMEARLTHLAYSTEIASAMLQRQQATAIIAAREKIVEGAVGMVQMAIAKLELESGLQLDEERKAAMMNNLMVAIVSDRSAQPVINASSLY